MTEGNRSTCRIVESHSDYKDLVFEQFDATKSSITGSRFEHCLFRRVQLPESSLSRCTFENCVFEACDLSLLRGNSSVFADVQFRESKLMGVHWALARRCSNISFQKCVLDYCSFVGLDFRKTEFLDCRMIDVNFAETNLKESSFPGSDLTGCRFLKTNLTKCDLSNARGYVIHPDVNTVNGLRVSLVGAVSLVQGFGIRVDGFSE